MKIGSLFRARAYLTNEAIMYIYKSVIRPSMEKFIFAERLFLSVKFAGIYVAD